MDNAQCEGYNVPRAFMFKSKPWDVSLGLEPVSYTHLDVYKRQLLLSSLSNMFDKPTQIPAIFLKK